MTRIIALTRREQQVADLLLCGCSQKLIANQLGIAIGTVSAMINRIRRKLRVRTHADLVIALWLRSGPESRPDTGHDERLTPAERAVVELVLVGLSNAEIAKRRSTSARTVANQLAGIYGKLRVDGRPQLITRCLGTYRK